ncbi:GTP:adenosylcobinamide-phosphate guanylyltransferase [Halanaeroarchaeum sp. HSR-CO]|nr:GTP:adenosylcobinamide-phosphate guanylyltransferase [Halanaeroarchaeum sp. HSR-CO]
MAGGQGTRLGRGEKPLCEIGGVPMVDRVLRALEDSEIDRALVVTSPQTPATAAHVSAPVVETPGDGYVADLGVALERVSLPVLTVVADLPLLSGAVVDRILDATGTDSTTVCVPADLPHRLGATVDRTTTVDGRTAVPTGVNVVGATDRTETLIMHEPTLAVNVNRPRDARVAEALA